jgi:protoporphyrinogen oxidase
VEVASVRKIEAQTEGKNQTGDINASPRVAVIGAGPMGLAAALELCKKGARVDLLERDDRLGGMSAQFDFAGTRIERYYHFVCGPDETTFQYLRDFGLEDKLRWTETRMGFYWNGKLHDWGNPRALLAFPGLSFLQKLRYGLHVMRAKGITDWRPYDKLTSTEWVQKWIGKPAYEVMWRSLFRYKFYEHEDTLSAAWLGTRIKRVALSRKSIFQERLGYLEGGSEVLLDALARQLVQLGGSIELSRPVDAVVTDGGDGGRVRGIRIGTEERPYDAVVSTVPLPHVPALVPDLPSSERAMIEAVRNVGVVCVILKLKRPTATDPRPDRVHEPESAG